MPHYLPSDFEIDTDTRTVMHKASGRKYSWDRSPEIGDATHYHHSAEGHTDISPAIAMILSVTGSKHFERQSTRRDARKPRKMDAMSYFQSVPGPGTSGV